MSLTHASSVVTNGLVFAYDQNSARSYKGPAVQNLANNIALVGTGTTTGYASAGSTESVNIPGLGPVLVYKNTIQNNYTSFTPNSANCCPSLHSWGNINVTPSTLYTYLILYKCDSGYTSPNYMYRYEYTSNGGTFVTEGGVHSTTNRVHLGGGWYYAWGTFTTQATTTWLGHCGTFYYRYSNVPDRLSVAKVAIIPGNYSGLHPKYWPNSASTRTNTQAVIDLTGNTTITANSLTYSTDGSFSFKASGQRLDTAISTFGNNATWEAWINGTSNVSTYNMFMGRYLPYFGFYNANRLFFSNSIGGAQRTIETAANLSTNTWYHAVFTTSYDGVNTTMKIYTNGVETASGTFAGAQGGEGANLFAIGDGYNASWYRFDGQVTAVKVYNRTLSTAEVKQNFNAMRGRYGV